MIAAEKLRFGLKNRLWHGACHWQGMQQTDGIIDTSRDAPTARRRQLAGLELTLHVTDPELCDELEGYPEGRARHDFAIGALRIGALALRHATARVDVESVRAEGDRLLEQLRQALDGHQKGIAQELAGRLTEYFDPQSGRFSERVERLIKQDGELEQLLRRQVGLNGSELARTLATHVGQNSPLMALLDPERGDGFLGSLAASLEETLAGQRERILREFSLDNKEGALSRLVSELRRRHGEVGQALQTQIDQVVAEFSLDRDDSALSRLVRRVEQAQKQISSEFSLDQENSALARMRRELLQVIEAQRQANDRFQREVLEKLAEVAARKQEADRSTRHGNDFEKAVFGFVQGLSQKAGDVAAPAGFTTGLIKHCKKGDIVVELGPDHTAAGVRIVAEAKENASFTLQKALAELEEARKNRGASIGLFVFSARTAPDGLEPLTRYGNDVVVVWDAEDPHSDVVLAAGLSVAKALCTHSKAKREAEIADFEAIERAIREVEKQAQSLDQIAGWAGTIRTNGDNILKRVDIMRSSLVRQVELLDGKVDDLRLLVANAQ